MIGQLVSHYHVLECAGAEGMVVHWNAHNLTLRHNVARRSSPSCVVSIFNENHRFTRQMHRSTTLFNSNILIAGESDENPSTSEKRRRRLNSFHKLSQFSRKALSYWPITDMNSPLKPFPWIDETQEVCVSRRRLL